MISVFERASAFDCTDTVFRNEFCGDSDVERFKAGNLVKIDA